MNDEKLDIAKKYLDTFPTYEDFKRDYLDVYNPSNAVFLTFLFNEIKDKPDVWEATKYYISTDTLRLGKEFKNNPDITIDDIISETQKYDLTKYKRLILNLESKDYENIDKLNDLDIDVYIGLKTDKGLITVDEFKILREFINNFIKQYNFPSLSQLEKITLAYDHTKFFSYNLEESDNIIDSRSVAKSMVTGNIVCEAYSRMFSQLLYEMGIDSYLVLTEPNEKHEYGHARNIIRVNDSKYNISGVFAFDSTWDSDAEMKLVTHADGVSAYEMGKSIKPDDAVLEDMPSSIRYLYFMVPLDEYGKYFPNETIKSVRKFPLNKELEFTEKQLKFFQYNDGKPRNKFVLDFLPDLLTRTKKIEGYSDDEILNFVNHAINIVNQTRFGRLDKNIVNEFSQR